MQTHPAKRIEIIIEAPLLRRLTDALDKADVPGYTVLPVLAGSGKSGPWSREGQVSSAGGMASVTLVTTVERADQVLETAFAVVQPHIGIVSVTDCEVIRPARFA
ncbi:nitrogen regulatory protein PII [Rubricella aquisinus]|uniref:Nitrogen regulatory protein P-II n=1 Tax=Rubricella aquisinus TaxID=2028108 RepID=A0A840X563_9RHOB|nr:transcriptional regulator [Rubricella aquisinus]MBB5516975.1 nitrogen regulatory protein PII [Rubricella aquisinus]